MTCAEFVELVSAYLDGELDPDAEPRFAEHMALCEGCERYLDQFRMTIGWLAGETPGTPTTGPGVSPMSTAPKPP